MAGYHRREIVKGILGQASKIREEHDEFLDAVEQGNPVMALLELSDLIGAIEAYAAGYRMTLAELIRMKDATRNAFVTGVRK